MRSSNSWNSIDDFSENCDVELKKKKNKKKTLDQKKILKLSKRERKRRKRNKTKIGNWKIRATRKSWKGQKDLSSDKTEILGGQTFVTQQNGGRGGWGATHRLQYETGQGEGEGRGGSRKNDFQEGKKEKVKVKVKHRQEISNQKVVGKNKTRKKKKKKKQKGFFLFCVSLFFLIHRYLVILY